MRAHRIVVVATTLATAATLMGVTQPAAHAAPTELFFSEYIEGSSNNKALEIYNGTGAASIWRLADTSVQMFFNGNTDRRRSRST